MLLLSLMAVLLQQLSCDSGTGHDDTHFQSLLQMWFHDSTTFPSSRANYRSTTRVVPYFTPSANLSTQLGGLVIFHCRVNNLIDNTTVSWLRRKDGQLQLLSVGVEVYSADGRFSASFVRPNDWQLRLISAQDRDQGLYECQVSSHPPIVQTVYLQVVVPELQIVDERRDPIRNKFYNAGSTIELKCVIIRVPHLKDHVVWRHGTKVLNYDTARGGISVKTDVTPEGASSRLFIANARIGDSGNYTCSLSNMAAYTIALHVLDGETPAAMQHGASHRVHPSLSLVGVMTLLHYFSVR